MRFRSPFSVSTIYRLEQFHFHSPSENELNAQKFPMELHFAFEDAKKQTAVLAVFMKEGKENPAVAALWKHLPASGKEAAIKENVPLNVLLPAKRVYYLFDGSLTTPPCTHHVKWVVLEEPITVSEKQIQHFRELYFGNVRPVQTLNGRLLERSSG